ncbi:zinc finger MYM-type protein 1-like [Myzus persicae]|uniref:zinc finger MYM-type protein 1-like n=1 Tax=Myzus persicae TaxID=13164 RepID=UPI000B938AE8|nr:zinc finger MYM-type protein 1-like [Myzus persicae]XP_022175845.1 zinc finger MYM-type protein 1-like [Myzus persicae]XP_022176619.1 zinc finger MYM-type protein 1-like [Myzus persicae]XP_022183757.1 zinc finger MYM-type protein 1-like [Myzus persicae]
MNTDSNNCLIEHLLENEFHLKNVDEKLTIVKNGRPCPEIPKLTSNHKEKNKVYIRHFNISNYLNTPWLTGSAKLNKLFCWPCVLFTREKNVWSHSGFVNLNNLTNGIQKHERSQTHISSVLKLKMFGKSRIDLQLDEQRRSDVIRHNELVKKNRDVLKRFIDCVCFLAIHELPFRGHNERVNSFNQGNFLGCLNLLSSYDSILNVHLETSKIFRGTSNRIQNDLICSVSNIISTSIESEIKNTNFVAILLDETSDITNLSQLSTTLRYVHHETGEAHERFISFVDVSADRSADGLLKHVIDIVNRYELKHKLVAQTYDGAAVMSGHVGGLQVKVKELYPKALFVHCFSHSLNLVLSQSASNIKDCKIFFQTLTGMGSFFTKSSKRTHALSNFTRKKMPKNAPTRWNFSSRLVNTVHEYNSYFIEFFQHVLDNSNDWDNEAIVLSQGFINFLDSRQTYFLLIVFSKIFSLTDILYEVLQTKRLDILYCVKKIEETKCQLQNYRLNLFEKLWETVLSDKGDFELQRKIRDPKTFYKVLFNEIFDNILTNLQARFGSLIKFEFLSLIDPSKYSNYTNEFPNSALENLQESNFGEIFDFIRLRNELIVLYKSEEFLNTNPYDLVKKIKMNDLISAFQEVFKLGQLILTIPSTTASVERSFSALKRIKSYQRSTQGQERLSSLSLISIEKELLHKEKNHPEFYDKVINEFLKQERRMDFIYK